MKKNRFRLLALAIGIIVYAVVLVNISMLQSDYEVEVITEKDSYEFSAMAEDYYYIPVKIKNNSNRLLSSVTGQDVYMTYHLYDSKGDLLAYENVRTPFEKGIFAKEKGDVSVKITPLGTGEYWIGIDILQEGIAWFSANEYEEKMIQIIVK